MSETDEMDKNDSGSEDKGLDLSASLRKMKPPNKKKFEGEVEQLMEQIRAKESDMRSLSICPDEKVQADLRKIRAEKDAAVERRKKVDADLKALNQEISQRMGQLSHLQSGLPYKNEERINSTISRLEMQLKTQNFKLSEEKKIVSEIDSLKRSKKVLGQYLGEKKLMDDMRDRQRRMREQRENYFKLTPHLKSREDELRKQNLTSKSKAAALKSQIDALYEDKRKMCSEFKRYEKQYYSLRDEMRKQQRRESIRKREEEKKAMMMAITREIAEYDAQKQPYEDERQLCNTLITYLQRFVTDTNDSTPHQEPPSPRQPPPSPRQTPAATLSPCSSLDEQLGASADGMYVLLRKSEEDLFSGINKKTRKNSKRKKQPLFQLIMDGALFNAAVARRHLRRERVFRDRQDPLATLRDSEIRERYRFSRQNIVRIAGIIREDIEHPTRRNHALPALFQLLLAIRFFTCGTYQRVIGDASIYVSISTVCRCIRAVSLALSRRMNAFIRFPVGDQVVETKRQLRNIAGFPNVIGLIDCTHVRIIAPHGNEADFVNRKGYHSLNVQAVCIANSYITDIVARWPGSCHDSRIFRESRLCEKFERREVDGLLLGDSGYALKPYLMTPFLAPLADAQRRYNSAHMRTRVRIEQTFGILKKRFGCLHGEIRMAPDRTCCVIVACVCLHNFAITQHDVYEDGVDGIDHQADVEMEPAGAHHQPDADGQIVRNVMVNYFN